MNKISRREWISNSLIVGAGLSLTPQLIFGANKSNLNDEIIRLNANENPYGPSQLAINAIKNSLVNSNRYPFAETNDLINKIAKTENLTPSYIMLGAGSSELLQLLGHWIVHNQYNLTYASPSFEIISNFVNKFGGTCYKTLLNEKFQIDLDALREQSYKKPGVVYIVNPNNPTGTKLNKSDLLDFCITVSKHSYIIIDEAYIEYLDKAESLKELTLVNPKIIIIRTFSKIYGLAGLRIGYLLAHPDTIDVLSPYQIWKSISVNRLGVHAAMVSLTDEEFIKSTIKKNQECLQYTTSELNKLGIRTINSVTNFLSFNTTNYNGNFSLSMQNNGILIGELDIAGDKWARVSIGNINEMKRFIEVTKNLW